MKTKACFLLMVAAGLLTQGCGAGGGVVSKRALSWHRCNGRFRCATLSVPVSYADPGGKQIPIAVVEMPATRPNPIADLVINPGGPGASGVQFLKRDWPTFPPSLRARFTLVSFDPRGDGSSQPLRCLKTPEQVRAWIGLNPAPATPRQIAGVVRATKAFARRCERSASTAFISSMSTANSARDMDRLRAALGQAQLTYVGYSYGTYLGTLYAEMFPKRVRALVLDGAVDPALGNDTLEAEQAAGFETDLHAFFAWCAGRSSCRGSSPAAPAKAFAALMARFKGGRTITAHLAPAFGGQERVNYGVALLGVIAALYSKDTWPFLGRALAASETGDGTLLAAAAYSYAGANRDGTFSNILSANEATSCLDRPAPTTIRGYKRRAERLARSAPDFGAAEAWSTIVCTYWPVRAEARPAAAHAPGAPPILVIGSTEDPATPYAWAKALADQLPRATLLTRTGAGHTAYRASSCIRRWVDRYLRTLKMPPPRTVCPSD